MPLLGKNFIYNGKESGNILSGLLLCSIDNFSSDESFLDRTLLTGDIHQHRPSPNHYGIKYSNTLTFDLSLVKDDQTPFSQAEARTLISWMTSPKTPRPFELTGYSEDSILNDLVFYCIFNSVNNFTIGNELMGLTFHATCNAPYGFSKEIVNTHTSSFIIYNSSDELEDYYHPTLEILGKASGNVTIKNTTDADFGEMKLYVFKDQTIYMDCRTGLITDNRNTFNFSEHFNLNYLRLVPGNNSITISGDIQLKIKCQYPRKVWS